MHRILSILPKGEGFTAQAFGAIALCVRDFTLASSYRTDTIVVGGTTSEGFEGIDYAAAPPARWFENRTRAYARFCIETLDNEDADLAEIHNRPNLVRMIAPKFPGKMALHLHNDPQDMDYTRTSKERSTLLSRIAMVYCVSDYIRERFLDGLDSAAEAKVQVVQNGIALPGRPLRKDNLIVFAGRMTEGKGALVLAEALRAVLPQLPDWRAILIGSGRHEKSDALTPYEQQVTQMLAPVKSQIELAGFLTHEETLGYFARASIAVVPSLWQEPFGRTAIEALAHSCAVISSGRGALREVTEDAALTLEDFTPRALELGLLLLASNIQTREKLQSMARARALHFAIDKRTAALDALRTHILAGENA